MHGDTGDEVCSSATSNRGIARGRGDTGYAYIHQWLLDVVFYEKYYSTLCKFNVKAAQMHA